jgi:hypothetical protein
MKDKKCSKCKNIMPISEFAKRKDSKDGYQYQCRKCLKQCLKQWGEENKEHKKQYQKQWHKNNKEHEKQWREDNKVYMKEYKKQWEINNRKKRNQYMNQYRSNSLQVRLSRHISGGIMRSLKNGKNGSHWEDLVNYTLQDLINHLERQFKFGMSWDNYGEWHIDHIIPISLWGFDSYNDREFKQCWSLANLQPLWAEENLRKSNKIIEEI